MNSSFHTLQNKLIVSLASELESKCRLKISISISAKMVNFKRANFFGWNLSIFSFFTFLYIETEVMGWAEPKKIFSFKTNHLNVHVRRKRNYHSPWWSKYFSFRIYISDFKLTFDEEILKILFTTQHNEEKNWFSSYSCSWWNLELYNVACIKMHGYSQLRRWHWKLSAFAFADSVIRQHLMRVEKFAFI